MIKLLEFSANNEGFDDLHKVVDNLKQEKDWGSWTEIWRWHDDLEVWKVTVRFSDVARCQNAEDS